ncbi:cadherin-like and PC-esterase domain-containing 1, partial [Elysia marginata]
ALPCDYQVGLSSLSEYLQEKNILEDMAPVLLARDTTATSVSQALLSLGFHMKLSCCDLKFSDVSKVAELKSIVTRPYLQLWPEFSILNTQYEMWADYNTTLVNLEVFPAHCQARAKLAEVDDGNRSGSGNLSLGLGENVVHIKLENGTGQPVTLATYTLVIYRQARFAAHQVSPERAGGQLSVCALTQDCALRYIPEEPCGLKSWNDTTSSGGETTGGQWTWDQFLVFHSQLPFCHSGYADAARWLVPCSTCSDVSSCVWNDAVWHQDSCREARLSQGELQHCLTGRQVLFIGDSTNRGILNYISKRVNGSLLEWDKTHTMRVYSDLNNGRTVFGFAYYPQFWLDPGSRPFFDVAFSRLRHRGWSDGDGSGSGRSSLADQSSPGGAADNTGQVSADQPSVLSKLSPDSASGQVPTPQVQYSVHGEINAAYSEMVINRICQG